MDTLTDRAKLRAFRDRRVLWREKVQKGELDYDMEEQQRVMGKWIAQYFDDAGYEVWAGAPARPNQSRHLARMSVVSPAHPPADFPELFKAMLMNAFPPIDKIDGKRTEWVSLRQFEQIQLDFVGVVDAHLQMEQASGAKNSLFAEQACSAKSY